MKTKTKKPPKVTLAYCARLFKKHDVKGESWQALEEGVSSPRVTPELLVWVLKNCGPEDRFHTESDSGEWYDRDGDGRDGRCFLSGCFLDDHHRMAGFIDDEELDDFQPPFYDTKSAADHDRDALNRILEEHFGVVPRPRQPVLTPEGLVSRMLLGGGFCCPMCGNDRVEILDSVDYSGPAVVHPCSCGECHAEWEQSYVVQGYRNLRIP